MSDDAFDGIAKRVAIDELLLEHCAATYSPFRVKYWARITGARYFISAFGANNRREFRRRVLYWKQAFSLPEAMALLLETERLQ